MLKRNNSENHLINVLNLKANKNNFFQSYSSRNGEKTVL